MKRILSLDITVKELLDQCPELLKTFLDIGYQCVGCPTEAFHTLSDVAREYGIDQDQLLRRLQSVIETGSGSSELNS